MVCYGNKYKGEYKSSGTIAMLEMLYTMLTVQQNNRVVKVANMVGFVRRKQKKK